MFSTSSLDNSDPFHCSFIRCFFACSFQIALYGPLEKHFSHEYFKKTTCLLVVKSRRGRETGKEGGRQKGKERERDFPSTGWH